MGRGCLQGSGHLASGYAPQANVLCLPPNPLPINLQGGPRSIFHVRRLMDPISCRPRSVFYIFKRMGHTNFNTKSHRLTWQTVFWKLPWGGHLLTSYIARDLCQVEKPTWSLLEVQEGKFSNIFPLHLLFSCSESSTLYASCLLSFFTTLPERGQPHASLCL